MKKQNIDAGWEYTEAQGFFALRFAEWRPVTLPHDASIEKPRSASHPSTASGGYAWTGVATYRKNLHVPSDWQNQSVILEFEGAYMYAEVSVNGNRAALQPYGYSSFLVDIKPYLTYGAENVLTVGVNTSAQPNSRWYSGTGIYRHVWLRRGGEAYIPPWSAFVTTSGAAVSIATEIASATNAQVVLRSIILDASGTVVGQVETPLTVEFNAKVNQLLDLPNARQWSVDDPYLYTLISEVLIGGQVVDTEKTPFGVRSIEVDVQNGFRLNGVTMKIKGGCVHHDNGLLGAASYDRTEERKIEILKAAGYNAIRCAHNPPAPAMLDACDRLGMLVIDETFDCWRMGKNPNDYHLVFDDWWQRDTEAMVKRDRNHPSIIMWSIGNEVSERAGASDGYALCRKQADFVRSLDNTRPITAAVHNLFEEMVPDANLSMDQMIRLLNAPPANPDRWGNVTCEFFTPLDVAGYNYLWKRYESDGNTFPERVICGTETWPHEAYDSWQATMRLPNVIGDFVWTAIDYLGESGIGQVVFGEMKQFLVDYPYHLANCGDFDICGFKRPQSFYRDILWGVRIAPYIGVLDPHDYGKNVRFGPWAWEPVSDCWDFPGSDGSPTRVDVYSADAEVELLINGTSVGRRATYKNKASFDVVYTSGTIEALGISGRTALQTACAPAALRLTADREHLRAEFGDLAYITVEVVDENGLVVKHAQHEVSLEVAGVGALIAVGTANPVSEEDYIGSKRKAFGGRLMAVIRSCGQTGEISLTASAEGVAGCEIRLFTRGKLDTQ